MLLSELGRDPAPTMLASLKAASALPPPQQCATLEGDGGTIASSDELEELLSQAAAAFSLGDEPRVAELATKALTKAEAEDDRRAQARALDLLASSFREGDTDEAEVQLRRAIKLSTEVGDHGLASEAWNDLARMLIHGRRDLPNASFAMDMADAEAAQADDTPIHQLGRLRYRIEYAAVAGELEDGRASLEQARALLAEHDIPDGIRFHFRMTEAQFCLATGEYEPMLDALIEIRDGWAKLFGPEAPDVKRAQMNVGLGLIRVERFADAQAELEPLLEFEDDPVTRSVLLWTLGDARAGLEDLDGALRWFDQSLELLSGLEHPPAHRLLELRLRRFDTLLRMGRLDAAEGELQEAQKLREAAQSPVLASNIEMNLERLAEARAADPASESAAEP
jgi:tetratricopeptide (TPR) repeat protein